MNATDYDAARRDRLDRIFIRLNLPLDIIDMVLSVNPGADNPYHGTQHLLTVAARAAAAGELYGLPEKNQRELALAGLFHDYSHPLDKDDAVNIRAAVDGWYRLGAPYDCDARAEVVERLVWATKYPHSEPADISDAIMQDADLMQWLEPDRERFYGALAEELSIVCNDLTNGEFLRALTINTKWARTLLAERMNFGL